jgi:hypothetical protein
MRIKPVGHFGGIGGENWVAPNWATYFCLFKDETGARMRRWMMPGEVLVD